MLINIRPFLKNKNYRLLYLGQAVSFLGSMITYVALPYQIFQMTQSSFIVGLLGTVQLVPLILTSLYGGALADSMNRRKLLLYSEVLLAFCMVLMWLNSVQTNPSLILIFVIAGLSSSILGFHRPAMEALTPLIVDKEDFPAIAALGSLRYALCAILGPAIAGVVIASYGISWAYVLDFLTFLFSFFMIYWMKNIPESENKGKANLGSILEGLKYAVSRPELVGTYLVDITAMIFAMPIALFPSLSQSWGGAKAAGWLFSAMPIGTLFFSLFSGWAHRLKRHGVGVILSATAWGVAIVGLAFAPNLIWACVFLALAGGFDSISALYRSTIWNSTIPKNYRGRLAAVEMLSYMTGPLIGNARAGFVASYSSNFLSILSGGILCVVGCIACIWVFPKFWKYTAEKLQ